MKLTKVYMLLFTTFLMIGLSACRNGDIDIPIDPGTGENELTTMVVYQPDLTIPENFEDMPIGTGSSNVPSAIGENTLRNSQDMLNPFARVFRSLNLTERQIAAIKGFMKERDDCIRRLMLMLRESEKDILQRANKAKREVMLALKNGEITREEAAKKLAAINKAAREALKNNPVRIRIMEQIKKCEDTFFENVGSVLDREQKAKWDAFVKKYIEARDKKRPTTRNTDG